MYTFHVMEEFSANNDIFKRDWICYQRCSSIQEANVHDYMIFLMTT